jgi:hypothetical protein
MACYVLPSECKGMREAHGGAKRAKHRAKRSPQCADPAKQGHAQIILSVNTTKNLNKMRSKNTLYFSIFILVIKKLRIKK